LPPGVNLPQVNNHWVKLSHSYLSSKGKKRHKTR